MRKSKQFWQGFVRVAFWLTFKALRHVPWKPALAWGTAMGTLGYHAAGRFRVVADKNLKIAYGDTMTGRERQALIKRVFQQFARASLVEFLKGAHFTKEDTAHWVQVDSYAPAYDLLARGKGVIVVSAHLGNWEWLTKRAAMEGFSVKVVARQSEDEKFNTLTDLVRGENGYTVHPRGDSPRALLKQLRENKIVAIVPDQKSEDVFVPFFGKLAGTVAGPAVLALKTGAAILPMFCPRQPDGTYKTVFYPPILPQPTGDTEADVKKIMTEITADIEDIVRQYPDQWLWLHDRWRVRLPNASLKAFMPNSLPPLADIQRLLVVKTSSIGDVIHALPVVQALKEAAPHLALGWVVRRRCADILRGNPIIDHLYIMPDKPSFRELLQMRRDLHSVHYDLALDMQGLFLSGLVTRLSGAPVRLGWDRNREGNALFLTHSIVPGKGRQAHEVDLLYGFPDALGLHVSHPEFTPQPYLAADGAAQAERWLADLPRPRIALNVGASRAYKRWPVENWRKVALSLTQAGRSIVFVGDKTDAVSVAQITPALGRNHADLSGKTTLRELASVLAACDLLVSGDSGPMHLAVAVGTPVVAIFGATHPVRHGPYGLRNTVLHDPAPSLNAAGKRPTEAEGAACMARITPKDVLEAVMALTPWVLKPTAEEYNCPSGRRSNKESPSSPKGVSSLLP